MSSPDRPFVRAAVDHLSTSIPVIKWALSSSSSSSRPRLSVQLAFVSGFQRDLEDILLPEDKAPVLAVQGSMMSPWRPGCSSHSLTPVIYACFPPLDTSAPCTH